LIPAEREVEIRDSLRDPLITSGIKIGLLRLLRLVRINGESNHLRILRLSGRFKLKRKTRPETAGLNLEKF
jgi:hypothetical protein